VSQQGDAGVNKQTPSLRRLTTEFLPQKIYRQNTDKLTEPAASEVSKERGEVPIKIEQLKDEINGFVITPEVGATRNYTTWTLGTTTKAIIPPQPNCSTCRITVELVGGARLGNLMFGHASMLGIARRRGFSPVVSTKPTNMQLLIDTFDLKTPKEKEETASWKVVNDNLPCGYDAATESITLEETLKLASKGISLHGCYQSWRYFDTMRDDIRQEFTFKEQYKIGASMFLRSVIESYYEFSPEVAVVGIHIRQGDMASLASSERGYTTATADYTIRAMELMEAKLNVTKLIYIICSDDIRWFRGNVKPTTRFPVVYSMYQINSSPAFDLAILAACNHTIITVGSYGWWAGYLAGGVTIYYKDFPKPGSAIAGQFKAEDYFPRTWIGIS